MAFIWDTKSFSGNMYIYLFFKAVSIRWCPTQSLAVLSVPCSQSPEQLRLIITSQSNISSEYPEEWPLCFHSPARAYRQSERLVDSDLVVTRCFESSQPQQLYQGCKQTLICMLAMSVRHSACQSVNHKSSLFLPLLKHFK